MTYLRATCVRYPPPRILSCRKQGRRLPPPSAPHGRKGAPGPDPAPRLCAAAVDDASVQPPPASAPDSNLCPRRQPPLQTSSGKSKGICLHCKKLCLQNLLIMHSELKRTGGSNRQELTLNMSCTCAARGLINHIIYESEKMTGRKFSG
ncbi:uncharacterized protein [Triticum aestivum]|uniref:uncharacterized protein isoform X1 n=1 Tax=Triticum aestivum TaxID=4565 RepID=UPI001D02BBD3|nr:uncharacterized protein LOC123130280 isoform X1 [Triticum aestivum]